MNGFNIGRFRNIGPQYTLFVPGGLLKDRDNVIEIFDAEHSGTAERLYGVKDAVYEYGS